MYIYCLNAFNNETDIEKKYNSSILVEFWNWKLIKLIYVSSPSLLDER